MADEAEVGDYEPLHHANEGRSSISLIFFKFFGVVFLAGALCYLFISNFNAWTMEAKKLSLSLEKQVALNIRPVMKESVVKEQQLKKVCDLSVGEWLPTAAGPAYTDETCIKKIPGYLNCLKNGRPDTGYLNWRWKPSACDLHPIDPLKFLNAMRNKSIAFLGASICHNHVVSLICQLSKVEEALDIFHDSSFKNRIWYYPSHNLTLYVIWSPFLIHYETIDNHGDKSQIDIHIHLDILDSKWISEYNKYDYVVISGGADFYRATIIYENNQVIGCHHCRPHMKLRHLAADEIYRKALQLSLKFIATAEHKAFVILRTWSPMHYENGVLPNEKVCNRTKPFREEEISGAPSDLKMREVEVEECEKAATIGARNGEGRTDGELPLVEVPRPDMASYEVAASKMAASEVAGIEAVASEAQLIRLVHQLLIFGLSLMFVDMVLEWIGPMVEVGLSMESIGQHFKNHVPRLLCAVGRILAQDSVWGVGELGLEAALGLVGSVKAGLVLVSPNSVSNLVAPSEVDYGNPVGYGCSKLQGEIRRAFTYYQTQPGGFGSEVGGFGCECDCRGGAWSGLELASIS